MKSLQKIIGKSNRDSTMQDEIASKPKSVKRSLNIKISLSVSVILLMIVVVLVGHSYFAARSSNLEQAISQVKGMNAFYFDSLNTLMIADVIEEREVLREKMLEMPGVVDVRVNRGESIVKKFGDGLPGELPVDELDHRALAGEQVIELQEVNGERVLTIVEPYLLTENTRGTDCLECHRKVEPGTVGGAVRISYSLAEVDAAALNNLWGELSVIVPMFVMGLLALTLVLNRVVVKPITSVMHRIKDIAVGEGDLSQSLEFKSNDELGELVYWFNMFVGKLKTMVDEIRDYIADLNESVDHMSVVSKQTATSVEKQRAETDQVASAMSQMSATVDEVHTNADEAAKTASITNEEAQNGKVVMDETIVAINSLASEVDKAGGVIAQLEKESNDINVVLEVIRNIADQTNLLALNAAIEAARAGEQGRGFAVVADEVRTLAERTQQSTLEIQQMIESLQSGTKDAVNVMTQGKQQADQSVTQAENAGHSLDKIITSVNSISSMSQKIADAAQQHSQVSAEINHSVVNINEATNRTATDSVEVETATKQLSVVAEKLCNIVKQFHTR
ncbi:MAG: HAMP domain-containing methyl-accepting chemotaxis protein [Gammaproteobacteria bacterium]|nr:HAMP domain-containing methyl-accepting chemotaxis protein [Gammaproteobacteria bacterium]